MSSTRPIATRPLHRAVSFPARNGGEALSVQIGIDDVAAYYADDPRCLPYCERGQWPRIYSGIHLQRDLSTYDDYARWMADFTLPDVFQFSALRAAGPLADSLEHLSKRVVERDLTQGRIDRYKLPDVGKAAAMGTYSDESVRPYRRVDYRDAYTPTVAVVASFETSATGGSGFYCAQVSTLAMSVLWACETAGLHAQAALVQARVTGGYHTLPDPYCEVIQGFMLTDPERVIPARAYGIFLNDMLWMHMKVAVKSARMDYARMICHMDGHPIEDGSLRNRFGTQRGGSAVHWARTVLGADIVVAIGKIDDGADAEVFMPHDFTVEQAVTLLAKEAEKL